MGAFALQEEQVQAAAIPPPAVSAPAPAQPVTGPGMAAPTEGQSTADWADAVKTEGLGFMLDPLGAADRAEARRELAGNFQIIDPDHPPAHPTGNQVTQEEYDKIAKEYSDVRLGRTDIQFDTSGVKGGEEAQGQYKRDAMGQMGRMMQTESGRALVEELAHNEKDKKVTFSPFKNNEGAETVAHGPGVGDGTGADANVQINPAVDKYAVGRDTDAWHQSRGDVVMYHEMVHALHDVRGDTDMREFVSKKESVEDNAYSVAGAEYQAVGLGIHKNEKDKNDKDGKALLPTENRYRQERAALTGQGTIAGDAHMAQRLLYRSSADG